MIIYRFKNKEDIPEQLREIKHIIVNKNYTYCSDIITSDFDNYNYINISNYDVFIDNLIPDLLLRKGARGEYITLADGNKWLIKTLKEMDYTYSYDPSQQKIIKLFDDILSNSTELIIQKGDNLNELDLLEIIFNSIIANYCITKEVILLNKLINSRIIGELINKILCIELLSNPDFFRTSDNSL